MEEQAAVTADSIVGGATKLAEETSTAFFDLLGRYLGSEDFQTLAMVLTLGSVGLVYFIAHFPFSKKVRDFFASEEGPNSRRYLRHVFSLSICLFSDLLPDMGGGYLICIAGGSGFLVDGILLLVQAGLKKVPFLNKIPAIADIQLF